MTEFEETTAKFLADSRIPLRLATTTPSGWPIVVSLWFVHLEGSLWCATQDSAVIVGHLKNDARCGFEVAPDRPRIEEFGGELKRRSMRTAVKKSSVPCLIDISEGRNRRLPGSCFRRARVRWRSKSPRFRGIAGTTGNG